MNKMGTKWEQYMNIEQNGNNVWAARQCLGKFLWGNCGNCVIVKGNENVSN